MIETGEPAMQRTRHAFSLLELTLVLVIMGVLMGVVAVSVTGYAKRAKVQATKTTMMAVKQHLATYEANYSTYPDNLTVLVPDYIESSPKDGWDRDLFYVTPGSTPGRPYELWSLGPDGQARTDDDLDIWVVMNE